MSIRKITNDRYQIDFFDGNNQRHRENVKGSKSFAKEVLAKRESEVLEGKYFPERQKQQLTFIEAADKYFDIHLSKKKSAKKTKCTIECLKRHFGNKPLARITTADVQEFYNKRMAETTPSTANRHYTVLHAIINKMLRLKLYRGENPCIGVAKHKENPARTNYLTKEQIQDVLTYVSERSQNMVAFAIGTGMRLGEILRLDWKDIDLANNIIHIYVAKSGYQREVPIMPSLKALLLRMEPQPYGKVFNISVKQVTADFKQALKQAGIQDIRFHDCRHTFASHFMMSGGSITDLQRILGHSDLKLTQRYAHLSPTYLRKSIEVVNDLIPQLQ